MIDPDEFMPDVKRENNSTKSFLRFHWVWDQPTYYDHDLNFLPWVKYNYYNGLAPGLMLYKGGPGYNGFAAAEPMWDLKNGKPIGKIYKVHNYEKNDLFHKSSLSFGGMHLHGTRSGNIIFRGSKNKDKVKMNFSLKLHSTTYSTRLLLIRVFINLERLLQRNSHLDIIKHLIVFLTK